LSFGGWPVVSPLPPLPRVEAGFALVHRRRSSKTPGENLVPLFDFPPIPVAGRPPWAGPASH